jgi:hypothetical protein
LVPQLRPKIAAAYTFLIQALENMTGSRVAVTAWIVKKVTVLSRIFHAA